MSQSLDRVWFVSDRQIVRGPFNPRELREQYAEGNLSESSLVWRKGHTEWMKLINWAQTPTYDDVWYLKSEGFNSGPYGISAILEKINSRQISTNASAWTPELKQWTSIYEIPQIIEQLGISRRRYPRAPLVGTVHLSGVEQENEITAMSISKGGLGIRFLEDPKLGVEYSMYLDSPLLRGNIYARGRLVYTYENETGIEFTHVSRENHSAIITYLMQFGSQFV
jgi:hypothetical protein